MSDEFAGIKKGRVASISQQWERQPPEDVSPTAGTPLGSRFRSPTAARKLWPGEALVSPARQSPHAASPSRIPFTGNPFAPRKESAASPSAATRRTSWFRSGSAKPTPHFTDDYTDDVIPEEEEVTPKKVILFDQSVPDTSPTSSVDADSREPVLEGSPAVPVRLFGPSAHIDPMLKAFAIQDNAEKYIDMDNSVDRGREGRALARGIWAWLHDTQQGQREWLSHELPCTVCHATPGDGVRTVMDKQFGFCSSLNLTYNDCDQYAWSFGSRYVVLEKQYWNLHPETLPAEVWATKLLKQRTQTPVPGIMAAWKEGNVAITITERAKGKPLAEMWDSLSEDTRTNIAKEVARYVKQWRTIKSPTISALDGGPYLDPERIIGCSDGLPTQFETETQYRNHIRAKLAGEGWDDDFKDLTLKLMPGSEPFVFTHGNLTLNNIFIDEGHVSSIVGLDRCAFLPVWAESLATHFAYGKHEREWKETLFGRIAYPEIKSYWNVCQELQITKPPDAQHGDAKAQGEAPARRVSLGLLDVQTQEEDRKIQEQAWDEKRQKRKEEKKKKAEEELKARLATMVEEKERKIAEKKTQPETAPETDVKTEAKTESTTQLSEEKQETDAVRKELEGEKTNPPLKKDEKRKPPRPLFLRQMKPQRQPKAKETIPDSQHTEKQADDKAPAPLADKERHQDAAKSPPVVERASADANQLSQVISEPKPSVAEAKIRPVSLPLSPATMEASSRLSSFQVKESGVAQESFPSGFHLYKTSGIGNECALRAVYKSFGSQYPQMKGFMTMQALREAFGFITQPKARKEEAPNEPPTPHQVQYWIHLRDAFDCWVRTNLPTNHHDKFRLGCIILNGDAYAEWWPSQPPSGDKSTVWVFRSGDSPGVKDEEPDENLGGARYQGVFTAGASRGSGDARRRKSQLRGALTPRFDESEVGLKSMESAEGAEVEIAPGLGGAGMALQEPQTDVFGGFGGGSGVRPTRRRTEEHGLVGSFFEDSGAVRAPRRHTGAASERLPGDVTKTEPLEGLRLGGISAEVVSRNANTTRLGTTAEDSLERGLISLEDELQDAVGQDDEVFDAASNEMPRSEVESMETPALSGREAEGHERSREQAAAAGVYDTNLAGVARI